LSNETSGLPEHVTSPDSPLKQIFNFLSSMQMGIILLLLMAVISVFGTLRPMDQAIEYIYNSWWFLGLMALASLNLFLCTVGRIGPLSRQALRPRRDMAVDAVKRMSVSRVIKLKQASEPLAAAEVAFKASGLATSVVEGPNGPVLFGEKGRLAYFGSIVTHFSLLLVLLGAMYGSLTGFEVDGRGGMSGDTFFVREGNFHVNIQEVKMEYLDEEGAIRPRAKSNILVTRQGQKIGQQLVSINLPLRFEGITIYHSTFLWASQLTITDPQTGETITITSRKVLTFKPSVLLKNRINQKVWMQNNWA